MTASTVPLRAALNLRVSTARKAEHDVSIPDRKRHGETTFRFSRHGKRARASPCPIGQRRPGS